MAFPHRSIREWLRDIHLDLEGYAAKFDDLGYNGQFLIETVACFRLRLTLKLFIESTFC